MQLGNCIVTHIEGLGDPTSTFAALDPRNTDQMRMVEWLANAGWAVVAREGRGSPIAQRPCWGDARSALDSRRFNTIVPGSARHLTSAASGYERMKGNA